MANRTSPKTIAEALQLIKTMQWASVTDMAEWAGKDDATIYEWLRGTTEPKWNSIRLICRHCKTNCDEIRLALGAALFAGTDIVCAVPGADDETVRADVTGIMSGCIAATAEVADLAAKVSEAVSDGRIAASELVTVRRDCEEAKAKLQNVMRAVERLSEQPSRQFRIVK